MKKAITLFLFAGLLLGAANPIQGQITKKHKAHAEDLMTIVHLVDAQCPISMGSIGKMTSCKMTISDLVIECLVYEELLNLDALKKDPATLKANAENMVRNASGYMDTLLTLLVENKKGLVYNYTGIESNTKLTISFTYRELKELIDQKRQGSTDYLSVLMGALDVTNLQMPMVIDLGLTINKIYLDGDYVIYNCLTDENYYSIDDLREAIPVMKESIDELFDISDPSVALFISYCLNADKGIAYRYVGDQSGKVCFVPFTVKELKKLID